MKRKKLLTSFLILFVWACCHSAVSAQVIATENGRLEFVGLEKWDVATIEQSLGSGSLEKADCGIRHELTARLGFADAQCTSYIESGRAYRVIAVLEPASEGRIKYLPEPTTSLPTPPAWNDLVKIVEARKVLLAIVDYGSTFENATTNETLSPDEDQQWFATLHELNAEEDFVQATERLSGDRDYRHRAVAALVLMNFGERDAAWQALVAGLRDANEVVRAVCAEALLSLVSYAPRRVDWSASTSDLNSLLSGTNLMAYAWVIDILLTTRVSQKLARPLLKDDAGYLLLSYLKASHRRERETARRFLVRLSGKDFGFDSQRWQEWLASVQ